MGEGRGTLSALAEPARRAKRSVVEWRALRQVPAGVRPLATTIRREHLTYSTPAQLASLVELCERGERGNADAAIVEAGCARGGSALLMCATKSKGRPLDVYDVFGMIPPPSEQDGPDMQERYREIASGQAVALDGGRYYAYSDDLAAEVARTFAEHGYPIEENSVRLIKGKVQDTMAIDGPVCVGHIDVDWHDPVMHCLEQLTPHLVEGGSIVLRAYNDWSGCRSAAEEYFDRVGRSGFDFDDSAGHLVVTRRG
ncbi:MAG: TylF/MycF/NovP-related O-methyltransferase [Ilumatobacteraceae bacterium]